MQSIIFTENGKVMQKTLQEFWYESMIFLYEKLLKPTVLQLGWLYFP